VWCQGIWDVIVDKKWGFDTATKNIRGYIDKTQNFILYHYKYGSTYKTAFWSYAKKLAKDKGDKDLQNIINNIKHTEPGYLRSITTDDIVYAQWETWNLKLWYDAVTRKNDISNFNYR
jgi:hypothetical protein